MEFIKKQSVGFYLNALTVLMAIIGVVLYFGNCKTAYFANLGVDVTVAVCLIGAIVCELVFVLGNEFVGSKIVLDVFSVVTGVLLMIGLVTFISTRVNGIAAIMTFTNNANTMADLNNTIVAFVFCAIALILSIVSSFFSVTKE